MALITALTKKLPALAVAASLTMATTGCAMFDDGPPAPRESEAGGPEVMSDSGGNNQPLWIALIAVLVAGAAAGAASAQD